MTLDLVHRIRWANVARATAVVLALLLALAWPRLRAHPDALPPAVAPAPARAPDVAPSPRVEEPRPATAIPERRPTKRRRMVRRHRPQRHHRPRPRTVAVPAASPAAAFVTPPVVPAPAAEFRP